MLCGQPPHVWLITDQVVASWCWELNSFGLGRSVDLSRHRLRARRLGPAKELHEFTPNAAIRWTSLHLAIVRCQMWPIETMVAGWAWHW